MTEKSDPDHKSEIIHEGYTEDNTAAPDTDQEDTVNIEIVKGDDSVVLGITEDTYDFYDEDNIIDCGMNFKEEYIDQNERSEFDADNVNE